MQILGVLYLIQKVILMLFGRFDFVVFYFCGSSIRQLRKIPLFVLASFKNVSKFTRTTPLLITSKIDANTVVTKQLNNQKSDAQSKQKKKKEIINATLLQFTYNSHNCNDVITVPPPDL